MRTVGAFEAKTHLSKLLESVAKGEKIAIEKHGVPVAVLHPADSPKRDVSEIIGEIKRFRSGRQLGATSIRELIEDGRR
jgi:prevent-host-death family protein